ncbi:MAG: carboxypeptidase-like regulatory domain-containing protein [Thermodesulfobacteriota bacterium]
MNRSWIKWIIVAAVLGLVLFVLVLGFYSSLPFPGPFEGIVLDATTGQSIPGANVTANWWCHNNPLPDGPGHFTLSLSAKTGQDGRFKIKKQTNRGGLFGSSFSLTATAKGYINSVWVVDPKGTPLPRSTVNYPLVDTSLHTSLPGTLLIKLKPAEPVLRQAIKSDDPLISKIAEEELRKLKSR